MTTNPKKEVSQCCEWKEKANRIGWRLTGEDNWDGVETHLRIFGHLPKKMTCSRFRCEENEVSRGVGSYKQVEEFLNKISSEDSSITVVEKPEPVGTDCPCELGSEKHYHPDCPESKPDESVEDWDEEFDEIWEQDKRLDSEEVWTCAEVKKWVRALLSRQREKVMEEMEENALYLANESRQRGMKQERKRILEKIEVMKVTFIAGLRSDARRLLDSIPTDAVSKETLSAMEGVLNEKYGPLEAYNQALEDLKKELEV